MKIKSERDFWAGVVFLLLAIGFASSAMNHPLGSATQPGAGYFPLLLSILLGVLGMLVLFKSLTIEAEAGGAIGAVAWRPLLAILIAITVFGASLQRLGLVAGAALLVAIASLAARDCTWQGVLLNAALLGAACWLVFGIAWPLALPLWPRA